MYAYFYPPSRERRPRATDPDIVSHGRRVFGTSQPAGRFEPARAAGTEGRRLGRRRHKVCQRRVEQV